MGILSDINYSKGAYGKKAGQIDITKTPNYFNEVNTRANMGYQLGTMVIGSLFSIAGVISENCGGSGSSSNSSSGSGSGSGQTCTEIKEAIQGIQTKYGCNSVDEVYAKYQIAIADKSKAEHDFNKQGGEDKIKENSVGIDKNSVVIKDLKFENEVLSEEQKRLQKEKTLVDSNDPDKDNKTKQIEAKLQKINEDIKNNNEKIKNLEKANEDLTNNNKNLENLKKDLDKYIADFGKDVEKLRQLEQNLRRLEGRDAVEAFKNDDAKSITKILNALRTETDANKKADLKERLKEALQKYIDKHRKDSSQIFVKLAKQNGIEVQ